MCFTASLLASLHSVLFPADFEPCRTMYGLIIPLYAAG